MKELFNTLSSISNFFTEKRYVYQKGAPKPRPIEDIVGPSKAPKGKPMELGKDVERMLAQAEKQEKARGKKLVEAAKATVKIEEVSKDNPTLKRLETTLSLAGIKRDRVQEFVSDALIKAQKNYKQKPTQAYAYLGELNIVLTKWRENNATIAQRKRNVQDLVNGLDNINRKYFA